MRFTLPRLGAMTGITVGAVVILTIGGLALVSLESAARASASGAQEAALSLRWLAAALGVTTVFLLGFIVLLVAHLTAIVRAPLIELEQSISRIRQGATRERVAPTGSDEVRALAEAVNALADNLAQREAKLGRSMRISAIDSMINGVAHEVNTPLTVIWTNEHLAVHCLTTQSASAEKNRADASRLLERNRLNIVRLRRLSNALAEVAGRNRFDGGADMNLILTAIMALTNHQRNADVHVEMRLESQRRAMVRPDEIFHALHTLVLDISTKLAENATLAVWTRDEGDEVLLGIEGTAGGIVPELWELMQNPNARDEGTLTSDYRFVHSRIAASGGSISYEGHEAKAFAWKIRLPALPPTPEPNRRVLPVPNPEAVVD